MTNKALTHQGIINVYKRLLDEEVTTLKKNLILWDGWDYEALIEGADHSDRGFEIPGLPV